jgi:transcriptional regulator with XRE-family HTH domain
MNLGQVLRDARKRRGLSLRDVERETGVSNGHISLIESGTVLRPSPNILNRLAALYGTSYSLLMELAGYEAPEIRAIPGLDDVSDLSAAELEEVRRFVGYVRSARGAAS